MAMRIAGTPRQADWLALPGPERLKYLAKARGLLADGATAGAAEKAEGLRLDGFLYIIAHPRLPGIKIGRAFDPASRLRGYQTGCPERAYYLAHVSPYFEDCVAHEKTIHDTLSPWRLQGEWFSLPVSTASRLLDTLSPFRAAE